MAPQNKYGRFLPSKTEKAYKELSKKEILHIKKYLEEIYGITELKGLVFLKKKDDVWITTKKAANMNDINIKGLKINTIGFRAIRNSFQGMPKITTNFAQFLQGKIKKNIRELNEKELKEYIHGYDIEKKNENLQGYCVLTYKGKVIGVGQVRETTIKNQIPKGRVLKNII